MIEATHRANTHKGSVVAKTRCRCGAMLGGRISEAALLAQHLFFPGAQYCRNLYVEADELTLFDEQSRQLVITPTIHVAQLNDKKPYEVAGVGILGDRLVWDMWWHRGMAEAAAVRWRAGVLSWWCGKSDLGDMGNSK